MSLFRALLKQKKLKYIFNGHEAIDLGIRADNGKRLLWATCNVGANSPEEYGDYFAWGETTPKDIYSWNTYFDSNDTGTVTYKYPSSLTEVLLELKDDAAHVNWGDRWRMPTRKELSKLSACTLFQASYNNVNGICIQGTNGNFIFLPNCGLIFDDGIDYVNIRGRYLSNTSYRMNLTYASSFCLNTGEKFNTNGGYRYVGCSVRGVIELNDPTEIYYTTTDGEPIEDENLFGMGLESNTYENGIGILKFSKNVETISTVAFNDCSNLFSATLPDSVTSIGGYAFLFCTSLTSINIPNGVTNIGSFAFADCSNLTNITIPDSVTNIGGAAFRNCISFTSVAIPDDVTTIESSIFYGCYNLTSVIIPDGVTMIKSYAFYNCLNLSKIIYNGTKSQWAEITKGHEWKYNVPTSCIVLCTDGDINI